MSRVFVGSRKGKGKKRSNGSTSARATNESKSADKKGRHEAAVPAHPAACTLQEVPCQAYATNELPPNSQGSSMSSRQQYSRQLTE